MLDEKERKALSRIIEILRENDRAADILGVKIDNLITLRDLKNRRHGVQNHHQLIN